MLPVKVFLLLQVRGGDEGRGPETGRAHEGRRRAIYTPWWVWIPPPCYLAGGAAHVRRHEEGRSPLLVCLGFQ